jgi:hypothetical protein
VTELVILGNGFDRHHGLETSYGSFAQFAKEHSPSVYDNLSALFLASSEYMGFDTPQRDDAESFIYERWCDFETCMGLIDDEEFGQRSNENISEYMQELGMEEYLVDEFVRNIAGILDTFRDWVASISLPISLRRNFSFAPSAHFVNFNYTETLETFYGVVPTRIFYIHGRRGTGEKLIVGHDTSPPEPRSKHDLPDINFNPFYGYLRLTRKPVEMIEPKLRQWLTEISKIEKVSVRGHSLGSVDLPYFFAISEMFPMASWSFSYFSQEDLDSVKRIINSIHLDAKAVLSVATLSEFEDNPDSKKNAIQKEKEF